MSFKWKDRDTQQSVLFWAAVGLLIYWGVRGNFNVNELILGIVVYVLTGQFLFGKREESKPVEKVSSVEQKAKPNVKRKASARNNGSSNRSVRYRFRFETAHRRSFPRPLCE